MHVFTENSSKLYHFKGFVFITLFLALLWIILQKMLLNQRKISKIRCNVLKQFLLQQNLFPKEIKKDDLAINQLNDDFRETSLNLSLH